MSLVFYQKIVLDITISRVQNIHCSQDDDNSRNILVNLSDNGKPYILSNDSSLFLKISKPDNTFVYIDEDDTEHLYRNDDGVICIILSDQATCVPGICEAELQIITTDKSVTTCKFNIIVKKSVVSDTEIESTIESNVVKKMISHLLNFENPHKVDKIQVGLGNVPNVTTNDQTPTYEESDTFVNITSGEKISISLGKIKKAISTLIEHIATKATTTQEGHVSLTDSVTSTSITTAATPNSVKTVNDNLSAETNRATSAESTITTNLNDEIDRAKTVESNLDRNKVDKTTVAGMNLGLVKSGTDITVDTSGNVSVNDNSHKHTVSNISDLTATASELNVLDGITATTTELNYTDGVTSNIQDQLDSKSNTNHTHDDIYYTESEINTKLNEKLNTTLKGSVNGLAELDENGKVPSSQLPSFVDDVIEGYYIDGEFYSKPTRASEDLIDPESGKIYVDIGTDHENRTYRWSGSGYVEISESLALGETSSTAYRGDRGKTAYDHSQSAHAPSNAEVNQNAFSNVIVGSTTVSADSKTDTLTLVEGDNVSITADSDTDKITISSTDTNTWRPLGTTADTACAGNDSRLSNARPASDVYSWAKASSKPSYAWNEITDKPSTFSPASHTHDYLPLGGGTVSGSITLGINSSGGIDGFNVAANNAGAIGSASYRFNVGYINFLNSARIRLSPEQSTTTTSYTGNLYCTSLTETRSYILQDKSGTIAMTDDLSSYLPLSGGDITGNVSLSKNDTFLKGITTSNSEVRLIGINNADNIHIGDSLNNSIPVFIDGKTYSYEFVANTTPSGFFRPVTTDKCYLGGGSNRWLTVYAKNTTISTSDRNMKREINDIDEKYSKLFDAIKPKTFMFNDGDRVHIGAISQDIEDSMNEIGIKPEEFAGFCKDIVYEYDYDEDGMKIENSERVSLDENGNTKYIYSLRYSEFIMLAIDEIQKLKKRVTELENK